MKNQLEPNSPWIKNTLQEIKYCEENTTIENIEMETKLVLLEERAKILQKKASILKNQNILLQKKLNPYTTYYSRISKDNYYCFLVKDKRFKYLLMLNTSIKTFACALISICTIGITAQESSKKDEKAITEVTINYITNFFANDWDETKKTFHTEMIKRGINKDISYQEISLQDLKKMMDRKKPLIVQNQDNNVEILHISKNTASVLLRTGYPTLKWKEYIHLAKENNQWKIINILWDYDEK